MSNIFSFNTKINKSTQIEVEKSNFSGNIANEKDNVFCQKCIFSYDYDNGKSKLTTPTNLNVDDNIISWDIVHFATKYRIVVNGKDYGETCCNFYAFEAIPAGIYSVSIKAISSSNCWSISDASDAVEVNINKIFQPLIVNVKDFGAIGDGKTNDRAAIQSAIDAVHANGGGKVIIDGDSTYLTSNIFLFDNITLEIKKNVILQQTSKKEEYVSIDKHGNIIKKEPFLGTNINNDFEFNHCWFYNYPLICAPIGTKNVSVIGEGTIKLMGCSNVKETIRCVAVGFGDTKYFKMDGFSVENYNSYAVAAFNSNYGIIKNLKISKFEGGCNDGVSTFNSSNIRITGCHIRSGDDSIDIGRISDPRGNVWFTRFIDFVKPCTNIEVDNNDVDPSKDIYKGLAFFLWGGGNKDISTAEVSNVYIHNNKFRTIGIWNSQSHDSLYGGYGIVPAKHIRWYDNEIGLAQGGFYYEGISDMNHFQSMRRIINGDFEYAGLSFWTCKNKVKLITDKNNHFAQLEDESEIYQGLYLNQKENYIFSAETCIDNGNYMMFVRDLETGKIVAQQSFNNASKQIVSINFEVQNESNYHVGFMCSKGSKLSVDNVDLTAPYYKDTYLDTGTPFLIDLKKDENSIFVEGHNLTHIEAKQISRGEKLQIAYFLDIEEIIDLKNGHVVFCPLIQRYKDLLWNTVWETKTLLNYCDFKINNGKVLIVFNLSLPDEYNKDTDYIAPRLRFYSSIKCKVKRMIVSNAKLDYTCFKDYTLVVKNNS